MTYIKRAAVDITAARPSCERRYAWSSLFAGGVAPGALGVGAGSVTAGRLGGITLSDGAGDGVGEIGSLDGADGVGEVLAFGARFDVLGRVAVADVTLASCFDEDALGATSCAGVVLSVPAAACVVSVLASFAVLSLEGAGSALGAAVANWLTVVVVFAEPLPTS
jgi:hypothetical protein